MDTLAQVYKCCGMKSFYSIYEMFPENLRTEIILKQKEVFAQMWDKLSEEEKSQIKQYDFVCDQIYIDADPAPYEAKIKELNELHDRKRNERISEVAHLSPDLASSILMNFENAHQKLLDIHTRLYNECKQKQDIMNKWEEESKLIHFSNPEK